MSTEISKNMSASMPAHISKEDKPQGVSDIKNYVRPPRLKIVQFQKSDAYDKFDPGTLIIVPQCAVINMPFTFTPLFFFPEWCAWNPIQMRSMLPVIRERTFNPQSSLAAKSKNSSQRTFDCPENKEYKCTIKEHLNFLVMIHGNTDVQNIPVVMTLISGEYKTGQKLLSMIQLRNASIYACIFEANVDKSKPRVNELGKWFGFDFINPDKPWVEKEAEFNVYKILHESYANSHANQAIVVEHDDLPDTGVNEPSDSSRF